MMLSVDGFSCLGAFGQGPEALCSALASPPVLLPEVDTAGLTAYFSPRAIRGSDRFSRLALLGACLALEDASFPPTGADAGFERWGIVLASGYGPVTPTLEFIDSLETYGQAMASPLAFSHSVHNIPAAVIAKTVAIVGPCSTVCVIENPVASGLLLAWAWLQEGRVDHVLFGAVDEVTPTLARTTERIVTERLMPEYRSRKDYPVCDGACFFCLSRDGARYRGGIQSVSLTASGCAVLEPDAAPGLRFLSGAVSSKMRAESKAVDGSAAYGNIPVAQAFDCVAALWQMAQQPKGGRALSIHTDRGLCGVVSLTGKGA